MILAPLLKLPKNVGDLGKFIVAKGFKKLPKVQKIAKCLQKLPKYDFFRKMNDFGTFTKIA